MLVTTNEAAYYASVTPATVRTWARRGLLPLVRHEMRKGRRVALYTLRDVVEVERNTRKRLRDIYPFGGLSSFMPDPQMLITTNRAADMAGVDPTTVRNWARRGLLPHAGYGMRAGRRVALYRVADVIKVERSTRTRVRAWRLKGLREIEAHVAGLPALEPPAT